jgi:hypothetical protein
MKRFQQKAPAAIAAQTSEPNPNQNAEEIRQTNAAQAAAPDSVSDDPEAQAEAARETAERIRKEVKEEARRRAAQESSPMDATVHSRRGDGEYFTS